MARRRFFVSEIRRGSAAVTGSDAEHLVRVLRVEPGQVFEISDNRAVYLAEVETARKSVVNFRVLESLPEEAPVARVHLYPALFKFDRFEWMIEKATELGVTSIAPFEATRSERGLLDASRKRLPRWERIALEASQQSRRARLPEFHAAGSFASVLQDQRHARLVLDEAASAVPILASIEHSFAMRAAEDDVALALGPEGGWVDEERAALAAAGWQLCSLGSTVLRAETAALAGLAVVNAAWRR